MSLTIILIIKSIDLNKQLPHIKEEIQQEILIYIVLTALLYVFEMINIELQLFYSQHSWLLYSSLS